MPVGFAPWASVAVSEIAVPANAVAVAVAVRVAARPTTLVCPLPPHGVATARLFASPPKAATHI